MLGRLKPITIDRNHSTRDEDDEIVVELPIMAMVWTSQTGSATA